MSGPHRLLQASFVPPETIRELRDLTRPGHRYRDRTPKIQHLEKFLDGSGPKLPFIISDLTWVSSQAMLDALVRGERDPAGSRNTKRSSPSCV